MFWGNGHMGLFPAFSILSVCPSGFWGLMLSGGSSSFSGCFSWPRNPFPVAVGLPETLHLATACFFKSLEISASCSLSQEDRGEVSFLCVLALLPLPFLQQTVNYN